MTFLRLSLLCLLLGTFTACGDISVSSTGPDTNGPDPGTCTTDSDCQTSLSCVVATCNKAKGTCSETVAPGKCLIGDTCYNDGQSEPGVPCKVCLPELDQYTFLNKTCGEGELCDTSTGDCVSDGSQECGNSKIEGTETCDDGNSTAGDGCSDACDTENGWECGAAGEACTDVNECDATESPCDPLATCTNTDGGFECVCGDGYEGDGTTCADVDECAADESPCGVNEACTNTDGGFECACAEGFLADDDGACQDVDECAADESPCDVNATCENTDGSYTCTCNEGWVGNDDGTCGDVDECAADESPCAANEDCTNVEGSFECACSAGYLADADGACQDVDECADTMAVSEDFSAVDEDGAPVMPEGWSIIWSDALDIEKEDPVSWFINADGQLQYSNAAGTDYNGDTNGVVALPKMDINEGDMLMASIALDLGDQYMGSYDKASIGFLSCSTDISFEECLLAYDQMAMDEDENMIATMVPLWSKADYNDAIDAMEEGTSGDLVDVSLDLSAAAGWSGWLHFAFDSVDSFGNTGSGFVIDNVMVSQASQVCGANEGCANTDGSFECSCLDGFEADADGACADIDECLAEDACGANEDCVNSEGAFECVCSAGYGNTEEDPACVDLNECALGTFECDMNATCENTEGNYTCICNDGTEGDGKTCTDIDECALGTDACGDYTTCANGGNSYLCQDGSCDDDACLAAVVALDSFCNSFWDSYCADCAAGGETWGGDSCAGQVNACAQFTKYTCDCDEGYGPDDGGLTCSDIDECATEVDMCAQNCANNAGGYDCSCDAGYTLADDGMGCDDIDECANGENDCANQCTNTPGGYECGCPAGYVLAADGAGCDDIDECADNNGGCVQNCVNNDGSYQCTCNAGYALNADGVTCDDVNECADNNGGCAQTCANSEGSFTCSCDKGYTLNADGLGCDDIDECKGINNCSPDATCANLGGSFSCTCNPGYSGDGVTCEKDAPFGGEYGPVHTFNGHQAEFYIGYGQGSCSVGSLDGDAQYFCQNFYDKSCTAKPGYYQTSTNANKEWVMHKNGGCTSKGEDIPGKQCEGGPCKIGQWDENLTGLKGIVCSCPLPCGNPNGGMLSGDNGTGLGASYCYNPKDSNETRAKKACESHHGEGKCCVIGGGYQGQQYGLCGDAGNSFHWHWDNHPANHCDVTKNGKPGKYVVGDVVNPGWCGTVTGNFLQ